MCTLTHTRTQHTQKVLLKLPAKAWEISSSPTRTGNQQQKQFAGGVCTLPHAQAMSKQKRQARHSKLSHKHWQSADKKGLKRSECTPTRTGTSRQRRQARKCEYSTTGTGNERTQTGMQGNSSSHAHGQSADKKGLKGSECTPTRTGSQ